MKFDTTISRAAAVGRAAHLGTTVLQTEPSHRVSCQYRDLAREVLDRIQLHAGEVEDGVGEVAVG